MGRKAGWLAYGAAIAGEASLVIGLEDIPEPWWSKEDTVEPETGKKVIDPATGKPKTRDIFDVHALVERCATTMVARDAEEKSYGVFVIAEGLAEYLPLRKSAIASKGIRADRDSGTSPSRSSNSAAAWGV